MDKQVARRHSRAHLWAKTHILFYKCISDFFCSKVQVVVVVVVIVVAVDPPGFNPRELGHERDLVHQREDLCERTRDKFARLDPSIVTTGSVSLPHASNTPAIGTWTPLAASAAPEL